MYLLLKCLVGLVAALPRGVALGLGRRIGALFWRGSRKHRERALDHLQLAFPDWTEERRRETGRRSFIQTAENALEMMRWMGGRAEEIERCFSFPTAPAIHALQERGKGVLVLTAHLDSFDLMGLWAASRFPLTIISKSLRNPGVNRFWMEQRARAGLHIVPAHNSYRDCLRTLRRNEVLGFILDQNMIREEGIFVNFFGRSACTTPGLAMMSAHSGAPVLPLFCVRRAGGGHELITAPPIDPPPDREPETIRDFTQRYTRAIEDAIREHPDQWIWMHRRWRTRPPEPASQGT
jgi:Kdo2-lipid IVA lauroyltransferase/acyltransferase